MQLQFSRTVSLQFHSFRAVKLQSVQRAGIEEIGPKFSVQPPGAIVGQI